MCGRKTLTKDIQSIIEEMAIESWDDSELYQLNYNIAPTQTSPVIVDKMGRHAKIMKWGLIPNWATDASIGSKLINARAETLLEKPSFQHLVPTQRCVVLADGYYEWKRSNSRAIPYYIFHPEKKILPMAGLWEIWKNISGENLFSYTIITTMSNSDLKEIHHRMPVILDNKNIDPWIKVHNISVANAMSLLEPYKSELKFHQVSTLVNSPRNNRIDCIKPVNSSENLSLF
jgi:putative SOS response-associated peptidase YedK